MLRLQCSFSVVKLMQAIDFNFEERMGLPFLWGFTSYTLIFVLHQQREKWQGSTGKKTGKQVCEVLDT